MKKSLLLFACSFCAATAVGAVFRYSLPKELSSFLERDGRLGVHLGGFLDVSVAEKEHIRIPVWNDVEGKVQIQPLKIVLISGTGREYPAGMATCAVGANPGEVLVTGRFRFTVDGGGGAVPSAGSYRIRIEFSAVGSAGEDVQLSSETTVVIKEPAP